VYERSRYYVIESQIYPGNSGAPVWVSYAGPDGNWTMFLLGVLSAGHPVNQALLAPGPKGKETVTYYNLGLCLVAPVERLVELMNSEDMNGLRLKGQPRPVKPVPP